MKKKVIKFLLLLVSFGLLGSCVNSELTEPMHSEYQETVSNESVEDQLLLYQDLKERIQEKQNLFRTEYPTVDQSLKEGLVALARDYIAVTLCDSIWSHWYGTSWDFYGTTETPQKGNIACGYFVTTTLKHAGYNIDRVTLAQQAASVIITTLCGKGKTKIIGNNNTNALIKYLETQSDGVFICGLDNHVGFIEKVGGKIYFVHSSGLTNQLKVMKEELSESMAIQYSNAYYVGDLLGNKETLLKWINGEKIPLTK